MGGACVMWEGLVRRGVYVKWEGLVWWGGVINSPWCIHCSYSVNPYANGHKSPYKQSLQRRAGLAFCPDGILFHYSQTVSEKRVI